MIAIRLLSRVEHNIYYAPTTEAFEPHRNATPYPYRNNCPQLSNL